MALEKELAAYKLLRPTLLDRWRGKWALIKNSDLVNVYDTYQDAANTGFKLYGSTGFLVKHIVDPEPVETGVPA